MARIERRRARIRCIRAQQQKAGKPSSEQVANKPEAHHIIGKSQNYPENISLFLQKHAGDPAVKVRY